MVSFTVTESFAGGGGDKKSLDLRGIDFIAALDLLAADSTAGSIAHQLETTATRANVQRGNQPTNEYTGPRHPPLRAIAPRSTVENWIMRLAQAGNKRNLTDVILTNRGDLLRSSGAFRIFLRFRDEQSPSISRNSANRFPLLQLDVVWVRRSNLDEGKVNQEGLLNRVSRGRKVTIILSRRNW